MSFYCLCTAKRIVTCESGYMVDDIDLDPQFDLETISGILPPERSMICAKTGSRQFLADRPNMNDNIIEGDSVVEHFPNVDVFYCPRCGSGFSR